MALYELEALAREGLEKDVEGVNWERGSRYSVSVTNHVLNCFGSFEFLANRTRFHSS